MVRSLNKINSRGFTLVELLIVVAIIGILSTVGIPTYRKMVQKSKKSEAKVNLGGIYTSEAAFMAEYGAFGSNLQKLGFEIEGGTRFYTVGFMDAACAEIAIAPLITENVGININAVFPDYYIDSQTRFLPTSSAGASVAQDICSAATIADNGATFTAVAAGIVRTDIALTAVTAAANLDIWTIDNNRVIRNTQDGVH